MKQERIKVFTTTINAGKHKGKKLEIPAISTTRSSKGILKESLFNTLQFEIIDKNFVEVFGGSGSVGLEALSRGAEDAYFIEYNHNAYKILERNAKAIDSEHTHLFMGNSFEIFPRVYELVKRSGRKTYFYFDPPFSTREGMDSVYDKTLELLAMIEPEVCEMVVVDVITSYSIHYTKLYECSDW